jgi:FkbM family methyltransferase
MILSERVVWRVGRALGTRWPRHRGNRLFRFVEVCCECFLHYYNNRFYDFDLNGEGRVLQCLKLPAGAVAFDVGAHTGRYSAQLLARNPRAVVHAFEINPRNVCQFAETLRNDCRLHIHQFGLSDTTGEVTVHDFSADGQISSVSETDPPGGTRRNTFTSTVQRGSDFLQSAGISEVHFLKIDTEGHDLCVLRGFLPHLKTRRIHVIQFEYNETSISARVFLKDFFNLLEPLGFDLGKVFPRTVEFQGYTTPLEEHRASNWIAVSRSSFAREVWRRLKWDSVR